MNGDHQGVQATLAWALSINSQEVQVALVLFTFRAGPAGGGSRYIHSSYPDYYAANTIFISSATCGAFSSRTK